MFGLDYTKCQQKATPFAHKEHATSFNSTAHELSPTANLSSTMDDLAANKKSVKYLTCYYWKQGGCKKTEAECLYSHFDTGIYAERPRPVRPGGPSVAGRNADVAGHGLGGNWRFPSLAHGESKLSGGIQNFSIPDPKSSTTPDGHRNAFSNFPIAQFGDLRLQNITSNTSISNNQRPMSKTPRQDLVISKGSPTSFSEHTKCGPSTIHSVSPHTDSPRSNHERRLTVGAGRPLPLPAHKKAAKDHALPTVQSLLRRVPNIPPDVILAMAKLDEGITKAMGNVMSASIQAMALGNLGDGAAAEMTHALQGTLHATYLQSLDYQSACRALLIEHINQLDNPKKD